jgi:hypothetical protein
MANLKKQSASAVFNTVCGNVCGIKKLSWVVTSALFLTNGGIAIEKAMAASIVQPGYNGAVQILYASPIGQTFTAEDPTIRSIGFAVEDFNPTFAPNDFDLTVSLFEGIGITNQFVGSSTFTNLSPNFSGFIDFDFSTVMLEVGQIYTAIIQDDTVRWGLRTNQHSFGVPGGTPIPGNAPDYPGGDLIEFGQVVPYSDATFRVLVAPTETVPEPSTTLGLLAISALVSATALKYKISHTLRGSLRQ